MSRMASLACLVAVAGASVSARGDDWVMHVTCDNQFHAYFGGPTATNFDAGGGDNWGTTYTLNANGRASLDYMYVATASDQSTAQGLIGDFTNTTTGRVSVTGDAIWEVFPAGAHLSQMGMGSGPWPPSLMPTQAQVDTAIAFATANNLWIAPGHGGLNGVSPWGLRPGISTDARWIWNNSNGSADPTQGSFNHDEFLVFRVAGAVPAPGGAALAMLGAVAGLRRRR